MRKQNLAKKFLMAVVIGSLFMGACGNNSENEVDNSLQNEVRNETELSEDKQWEKNETETDKTDEDKSEMTENKKEEAEKVSEINYDAENFLDKIVVADTIPMSGKVGKIEQISYKTKDYFGDESEIEKSAFVYLPYGYDETKQYDVLYLMHGIGGSEREWGMTDSNSKVKAIMDHLISREVIEPFIIVTPNGRSGKDFANPNSDYNAFYCFGKELRNELIPYIDSHYATYAEYDENGYDLTAARDHRAMAGLSMGGMQTTNIGMCECLDIISYFGAFSAAPTTYTAEVIVEKLAGFSDYPVNYYYGICGKEDGIAYSSSSAAVNGLTELTDALNDGDNFTWQEVKGQHDFLVWNLGFYNFAKIVFR